MLPEPSKADPTDQYSLRNQALISDLRSEIHDEWAKSVSEESRALHGQTASDRRSRTVEILLSLDTIKSLPETDRKWLEKLKAKVDKR